MCKNANAAIATIVLVTLFSVPAAANSIGSITASPTQANVGQTVTFSVIRAGFVDCTAVVEFGDDAQSAPFTLTNTPASVLHTYDAPGNYTALARGEGLPGVGCFGQDTDQVTVGDAPSGGRPQATVVPERTIGPRRPSAAAADKDRTIKPLPPRPALDTSGGPLTSLFETRMLTMDDPVVRVLSCGEDGNSNGCNRKGHDGDPCVSLFVAYYPFLPGPPDPTPTIFGVHANCPATTEWDEGTDRYQITLGNGWFISKVVEQKTGNSSSDEVVEFSAVPTGPGVTTANIDVRWEASIGDHARYWMRIEATGPVGTQPF